MLPCIFSLVCSFASSDSSTNYTSFRNWLIMGCKLRPELAAETQQTAWSKMWAKVKSISFNQGNSTDCYIILGHRDKAAPPTSQQVGQVAPKRVKYRHRHPFFFFFLPHPQESSLLSTNQRQCSPNWANIPKTC